MNNFNYILNSIENAEFKHTPFKHLLIEDLFNEEHLKLILENQQIHFPPVNTDKELTDSLSENDYSIINFPGCTIDIDEYFSCLHKNKWDNIHVSLGDGELEGYGVAYRLASYRDNVLKDLMEFMNGSLFHEALEKKFGLSKPTRIISAVQKYLTGYEISPHCDIKAKALTYLININKTSDSENMDIHTHLLEFKEEYQYISDDWEKNTVEDRCWIPWRWCETKKMASKNNSMLIFSPDYNTLHAVKLNYDHNQMQRTQIYGNLMYNNPEKYKRQNYKNLSLLKK